MKIHWLKTNPASTSIGLAEIQGEETDLLLKAAAELDHMHPKRKMEYLASRELLERLCQQLNIPYRGIWKDEFGKPHLTESDIHISISHSYPYVGCAIHYNHPCGIDIESKRPQLLKIRKKFLNKDELAFCGEDLEKLCLHWSSKEVIYKMFGRKQLLFAEQMAVTSIDDNKITARLDYDDYTENYLLNYEYFSEYLVVYNI